ncbi:BglG family transcription antiterminator [Bacillus changyiensis]|uniref:BglG family transcription antiterminator n=1 Tax=Bacillus changyiensis TaxID=3004103 RepID=UPI0022E8E51C|nr:BglG family transcription antiterminator [Bacillus changyiensis]MDA1477833.1 BglG family transcription antiterminator [Bacillus changyiensis]
MINEKRPARLLQYLVRAREVTMHQLIDHFQLSRRQICYDLEKINQYLTDHEMPVIEYKRKKQLKMSDEVLEFVSHQAQLKIVRSFVLTEEERIQLIYLFLFVRREPVSSAHLTQLLQVSKNTVVKDVKKANQKLQPFLVAIHYTRERGYHLKGSEFDKRVPVMHVLAACLQKPNGTALLQHMLKMSGVNHRPQEIKMVIEKVTEVYNLQFVEERLNEFIYFLMLYSERAKSGKVVRFHQQETELFKQNPLRCSAKNLLNGLGIPTSDSELCYMMIQLLGLSFGKPSACDPLFQLCEKLVFEFESRACITFAERSGVAQSLYRHLKPAFFRIKYRIPIHNPLLNKIKKEHRELYTIVQKLIHPLELLLNIPVPEEEIGFLTIHFAAMLEKPAQTRLTKKTAVVICPSGVSASLLLKQQLETLFSEICVVKTLSLHEFRSELFQKYDAVFSAIELDTKERYYMVSPLMTPAEKSRLVHDVYQHLFGIKSRELLIDDFFHILKKYAKIIDEKGLRESLREVTILQKMKEIKGERPVLKDLLTEETIQLAERIGGWEEAIKTAAKPLLEQGAISEGYIEAMIHNLKTMGPYMIIGPEIAVPHARPEMGVKKVGMSFLKLNEPVYFLNDKQYPVKLLFCIAAIDHITHLKALSQLTRLLSNKENQDMLKEADSIKSIQHLIESYSSY